MTKHSEPERVDAYMSALDHPLKPVLQALREVILATDPLIGEEIKWNAPTFFFAGEMVPTNPKEYRRYLAVSNLFRQDFIRLVFPSGKTIEDTSGLLEGEFKDDRKFALFYGLEDVAAKEVALQRVIRCWLDLLETRTP